MAKTREQLEAALKEAQIKKMELEQAQAKANTAENHRALLAHLRQMASIEKQLSNLDSRSVAYAASGSDIDSMVAEYNKKFRGSPFYVNPLMGANGKPHPEGSCIFTFENLAQATAFFNEQMLKGMTFLISEVGKGYNGHNFYACGDGQLYQGNAEKIIKDLRDFIANCADPDKKAKAEDGLEQFEKITNPSKAYSSRMGELRPPAPTDSPTPKPLGTKPKGI